MHERANLKKKQIKKEVPANDQCYIIIKLYMSQQNIDIKESWCFPF